MSLKEHILNEDLSEQVLEAIGCHSIVKHGNDYIKCGNKDGDNKSAITLYLNENLTVVNYTRTLSKTKRATDLIDLVMFNEGLSFPEALKFVCNIVGLDFYHNTLEDIPESLQLIKMLQGMLSNSDADDSQPLKPINNKILSYYINAGNKLWEDEGISLTTQSEFNVMYDHSTNYIAIPVYDEIGSLVGIKGRYFGAPDDYHPKYIALNKYSKGRVLYGYWQNRAFIKNSRFVYVVESEKSILKLAEMGVRNVVSTGGKTLTRYQVEMIVRTGCTPIIAFDKDVEEEELNGIAEMFIDGIDVYAIIDKDNLLEEKESPMDRQEAWEILSKDNVYKIR